MKVVVTDYVEPDLDWEAREAARRGFQFEGHQLVDAPEAEVIAATRDADVVVVNHVGVTAGLIAGWGKCRLVIRHGVGYDNADLPALHRAGIRLCYIPDYCTEDVAEHAIALLLGCGRKLPVARTVFDDGVRRGRWDYAVRLQPLPRIAGRTVGIVGCGRIGSRVYAKLHSFGVRFLVCDPYLPEQRRRELGIELSDLNEVLREADFVTIHTPLTRETRHMINRETLALMKPTAYLINTARGAIVDSSALAQALRNGMIGGAGIDVLEQEPPPVHDPLLALPNVILTPHAAWYSEEAARTIRELIMLEIGRFADGLPPRFSV
jgi:D-3-phosphoglycerate dehydrogenase